MKKHYEDLSSKPFFPGLVKYMASGPVVPMVWQGAGVVKTGRVMLGETNPKDSKPGTIRGDYCIEVRIGNIKRYRMSNPLCRHAPFRPFASRFGVPNTRFDFFEGDQAWPVGSTALGTVEGSVPKTRSTCHFVPVKLGHSN